MGNYTRAADRPIARLPDPPLISAEEVDEPEAWGKFVLPAGYDSAQQLLSPPRRVLVLTGPTGFGKRTMALHLLWDCLGWHWDEGKGLKIVELMPDWEEPDVGRLPVKRDHGYLLDLGRHDERLGRPFAVGLKDYASRLDKASSYLVITGTDAHWQDCEGVLEPQRIRLTEPAPARSIVEQWVQKKERLGWLEHPMIGQLADRLTPADAVRLADAIDSAPVDGESGIEYARTAYRRGRWWPDLASWFADHPHHADRALLIAAAVLDGCPADEVWQAGAALARRMGGDAPATGPRAGPGRTQLLEEFGLPEPRPDGLVSLAGGRPEFDGAVVDYVLAEHAELTGPLWCWLGDRTMTDGYVQHRVDQIARTIAGRAVRHGKPIFFTRLRTLADGEAGHRRLARAVLEQTSRDPTIGAAVRRQIGRWAERPGTRDPLVVAIAEACGGALAEQFPVVALATLRRILLRRGSAAVEQAALAALVRLASGGPERRRLVLQVVVRWMLQPAHRYAGGVAFLRLMHPGQGSTASELANRDADDPTVFRLLRCGWQWLPDTGVPESHATDLMARWEAAARSGQLRRDVVADLLVLAVEPDLRQLVTGPTGTTAAGAGSGDRRTELVGRILRLR